MTHTAFVSSRWSGKGKSVQRPAKPRCAAVETLEDRTLFALTIAPYSTSTPAIQLANRLLLGVPGLTITGASFVGGEGQAGNYGGFDLVSGANRLAISDGVLLTSGSATGALGNQNGPPDFVDANSGGDDLDVRLSRPGDPDLDALLNDFTSDANSLTITFTVASGVNSILFDFVFGSEEFPDFVGTINDGFAAFLDGQQVSFDANGNPISVNNNFFLLNNSGVTAGQDPDAAGKTGVTFPDVEYDGLTPVIRTQAPLNTGITTHTLKFVIADAADDRLDSGVFISRLQPSQRVFPGPTTDLPRPGRFNVSPVTITRRETDLFATVTIAREDGSSGQVSIDVATLNGTATAGSDYTAQNQTTLTFDDGETSQTITIPIFNDTLAEGDESFFVVLSNPTNGAALGTNFQGEVRIIDDELGVEYAQGVFSQVEGVEPVQATITVVLTGPAPSTISVNYTTTAGGTATENVDYRPTSGTLTFAPGVTSQTFQIEVLDDFLDEPTETVNLSLNTVTAPFTLGEFANAVLEIVNLDRPPSVIDAQFLTAGSLVNGVLLRYSEPMDEILTEDLKNYDLFLRKEKKLGGAVTRTRYEIISAVYEPTSRTVALTTAKPLKDNKVFEVVASTTQVQGIISAGGQQLDGNYDNVEGDDFTGYLTRGTKVNYFDEQGDKVALQLKGPGKMELFRDVERNARQLRFIQTSRDAIITGSVTPLLRGTISDRVTPIDTIFTGTGIRDQLPRNQFVVDDVIAGQS